MSFKRKAFTEMPFSKPRYFILFAVLVLLPLLFMGTRESHDWGDDFAQYIHQAGNIIHGVSQSETGFVYSQKNYIGPQAYPIGFPLMLAPVYAIFGNSISVFIFFISVIYLLMGVYLLLFYRRYFSQLTSFVLMLILMYNPQMLLFKREVMSDIPFTAILILFFVLYHKIKSDDLYKNLWLALLVGVLITIRPAGIVLVFAILTEKLILLVNHKNKHALFIASFFGIIPLLLYFGVNSFLCHIPSGGSISDYLQFYYSGNIMGLIPENFSHHLQVLRYMYEPESGALKGFSVLLGSGILTFVALGFLNRMLRKPGVVDWFFIYYVVMLLVFPNNNSGFRLMIPLGFLILFYAASGFKLLDLQFINGKLPIALTAGIVILALYSPGIFQIVRSQKLILEGPQQPQAQEAFQYINKNIPKNEIVVFAKPRALALYAGCQSVCDPFSTDPTMIHTEILHANARYLLVHKVLTNENMQRYQRIMQDRLTQVWANNDFKLMRINPAAHR